jgi:hypothetical protein
MQREPTCAIVPPDEQPVLIGKGDQVMVAVTVEVDRADGRDGSGNLEAQLWTAGQAHAQAAIPADRIVLLAVSVEIDRDSRASVRRGWVEPRCRVRRNAQTAQQDNSGEPPQAGHVHEG